MRNIFVVTLLSLMLIACNKDDELLPDNVFSDVYQLSDFSLNDAYLYWEIRLGNMEYQADDEDFILDSFDGDILEQLTPEQLSLLDHADTNNGFDAACAPSYCPIYAVALLTGSVFVVQSPSDLLVLFDVIDTEAELYYLLSVNASQAKYFQENSLGYKVIVEWDNLCGTRGEDLVQVYTDGTIEKIRQLNTESYQGCV